MYSVSGNHPLRRWFTSLVEGSFQQEVGLCDPSVLDYLSGLLTEFIHVGRINFLADGSGRRVEDVAEMLGESEIGPCAARDDLRRAVHRHIGDFTLFWTGVYPENLKRLRRRGGRDGLLSYLEQGKRSYAIASRIGGEDADPPAGLLSTLSDQFEYCVYGLGLVRKEWERSDPTSFAALGLVWD